jgi:hypothetical protein
MSVIVVFSNLSPSRADQFRRLLELGGYPSEKWNGGKPADDTVGLLLIGDPKDYGTIPDNVKKTVRGVTEHRVVALCEEPFRERRDDLERHLGFRILRWFPAGDVHHAALIAYKQLLTIGVVRRSSPHPERLSQEDKINLTALYKTLARIIEQNRYKRIDQLVVSSEINGLDELISDIDLFARIEPIAQLSPPEVIHRLWRDATSAIRAHGYYLASEVGIYKNMRVKDLLTLVEILNDRTRGLPATAHEAFHILELIEKVHRHVEENSKTTPEARNILNTLCSIVGKLTMHRDPLVYAFAAQLERSLFGDRTTFRSTDDLVNELARRLKEVNLMRDGELAPEQVMDRIEVALGVLRRMSVRSSEREEVIRIIADCFTSDYWAIRWWAISNLGAIVKVDDSASDQALSLGEGILFQTEWPPLHILALRDIMAVVLRGRCRDRATHVLRRYIGDYATNVSFKDPSKRAMDLLGTVSS